METHSQYMSAVRASQYLATHGVQRSVNTLAKLRWCGGGPVYSKVTRAVVYHKSDLDAWAEQMMSPRVKNSTEMRNLTSSIAA